MNRKQLILLLIAVAIIGGAGLVMFHHDKESWSVPDARMGEKAVPHFPYNEIAAVHLQTQGSDLNLIRKNDAWVVRERGDYPANFHQLSDALIKIRDLKVVQSEPVVESQLGQVNLLEPEKGRGSGILAEFKDAQGKVLESLILGKPHVPEQKKGSPFMPSADGRYVLLRNDPHNALLVSDALSALMPLPEHWLSGDFIKVDHVKSMASIATDATNSWKVSRQTEESPWVFANAKPDEKPDSTRINGLVGTMSVPLFKDVVPKPDIAAIGLDKPEVMEFETFDHFVYTLKIGGKDADGNRYVQVNVTADIPSGTDEKSAKLQEQLKHDQSFSSWVYVVGSWVINPLLSTRAQLIAKPNSPTEEASALPAPATEAPAPDDPFNTKNSAGK